MSYIPALNETELFLEDYLNFEKNPVKDIFWLDTMQFFANMLNNPQKSYKTVHIAGSKGKGSVAAFVASILECSQYRVGLFTSPHISDISERIGSATKPFCEDIYKDSFENLKDIIQALDIEKLPGKRKPTWFELITLYAFLCFRNENIDWGVFEVGLGGRLDSTNIIMPEFCIITPIELEHTEYLGNTLEKIAFEKSGIFKKNVPVFSAKQDDCVRKVLKQRANDIKTSIIFFDEIQTHNDLFLHIKQEKLRLQGKIQYENAQLAAFAIKTTLPHIDSKSIIQGIKQAFLPCRLETMLIRIQNKTISLVLDGSHTPKSLSLCLEAFFEQYGSDNHLLFACASDKDVNAMARIIKTSDCNFSDITLTIPGNIPRANFEKTHSAFCAYDDRQSIHGSENYEDSIRGAIAKAGTKQKTLLCVGSFYLCAEVKKISEDF